MATYVLVHGMWHGGWCWQRVRPLLQAAGHEVLTPTLTGLGERAHLHGQHIDFNTHVQDILNVLDYEDLDDVLLCGHSYGAGVVLAVAHQAPERLARLITLDGLMPTPNRSYRDAYPKFYDRLRELAIEEGNKWWVPMPPKWNFGITNDDDMAWLRAKVTTFPMKALETTIHFQLPINSKVPHTFISCTEGQPEEHLTAEKQAVSEQGWHYCTLNTGHDAMITDPDGLANLLLKLAPG